MSEKEIEDIPHTKNDKKVLSEMRDWLNETEYVGDEKLLKEVQEILKQ